MKEESWKILLKNIEWIKFSEAKAIFLLTIYGVLLTIIYSNSTTVYAAIASSKFAIYCTIAAAVLAGVSVFYSFRCLNPILKNSTPSSIIYYGHIQKAFKNPAEYYLSLKEVHDNEEEYVKQICEQVFVTSQISWKKFRNVSISIRAFIATMSLVFIDLIVYLFKI